MAATDTHASLPPPGRSGWLSLVNQALVTATGWQVLHHTHDHAGRILSQTLHHGQTGTSRSRVITHRGYTYRLDGYPVATVDETGDHRALALDQVGRITQVTGEDWVERYVYSPTGDIDQAQWPDCDAPNPARGGREYAGTLIRRAGRVRYEHDVQGRVILRQRLHHSGKPDTWRYTWDSEDSLTAVQTPDGTTWTYRYDPLGRRVGKYHHTTDGRAITERVDFTWDGPRLIETLHWRPDGQVEATTWDYRPDTFTPITQTNRSWLATAPQTEIDHRFHTIVCDLVGTPTHLITPDGHTTWHIQTTIWGTTITGARGQTDCPLRFPGQYHDPETGHHYNNQRHYDPETGCYLSKDTLGLDAGPNPVLYIHNPTVLTDPLGLCDEDHESLVRVGRWMGASEYDNMTATGLVQEGAGGTTYVAYPADPNAYMRQAKRHTRYVEFDVPASSLAPAGEPEWKQIPGPDSLRARLAARRGQPIPQFPQALNIEWLASKL